LRGKVTKKNIREGRKRVMLSFSISEYDDVALCADKAGLQIATLIQSRIKGAFRIEARNIRKGKYVPSWERGGNLFE